MSEATLSSKYQLVIPKEIREKMHLKVGQKFIVVAKDDGISLISELPLASLKGIAKGMDPSPIREKQDRV